MSDFQVVTLVGFGMGFCVGWYAKGWWLTRKHITHE